MEAGALRRPTVLGLLATSSVVVGAVLGGQVFVSALPGSWFFGSPEGLFGSFSPTGLDTPALSLFLVFGGLLLLTRSWLAIVRLLRSSPGTHVVWVMGVIAIWLIPVLVAPPLFSKDVFSYAAQGEMVSRHINPYTYGPGVLGATPFNILAGPLWANTPSPYGPVFLALDGVTTTLSGHHVLLDVVLLRLMTLIGLALIVVSLPILARAAGRDPAETLLLGAGSPLVLLIGIGGAHNDVLMVGLLVAGLAVASRFGTVPGILLCAAAAGVKAPAFLAVLFLGWNWPGRDASVGARVLGTLRAGAIGTATLAGLSWASGLGWGWARDLFAGASVFRSTTPVDAAAHVVTAVLRVAGSSIALTSVTSVTHVAGLAVFAVLSAFLLVSSPRLGPSCALGLSLLALALLGPILWPWYLLWGLVVLSTQILGPRLRAGLITVTIAGTFVGTTSVARIGEAVAQAGILNDLLLTIGMVAVAAMPLRGSALRSPNAVGTIHQWTKKPRRPAMLGPSRGGQTPDRPGHRFIRLLGHRALAAHRLLQQPLQPTHLGVVTRPAPRAMNPMPASTTRRINPNSVKATPHSTPGAS